jgi:phosphatidylinositol alpha 1,6-mannosyltransferase
VIHVNSPGEFGQIGAFLAHTLRIPLVASWHTNLHQFAARRLQKLLTFLPAGPREGVTSWAERAALVPLLRFYRIARVTLAPTPSLVRWLEDAIGRPAFLMPRGVDCEQFHPRQRSVNDGVLRLGYVGRVTPEKRVRFLVDIERAMVAAGHTNFSVVVLATETNARGWNKTCAMEFSPACFAGSFWRRRTPTWTYSYFHRGRTLTATWYRKLPLPACLRLSPRTEVPNASSSPE